MGSRELQLAGCQEGPDVTTIARAIELTNDGYKSQHERWFVRFGQYALESHFGCAVVRFEYEPCSWRTAVRKTC